MTLRRLLRLAVVLFAGGPTFAAVPCDSDADCQELLRSESFCMPGGTCSNPFRLGCLSTMGATVTDFFGAGTGNVSFTSRICNSDDTFHTNECKQPDFDYPEYRIHHANWETSVFQAWIYQIMMMEVLRTTATVGLSTEDTKINSFYSTGTAMEFSAQTYPYEALVAASHVQDCNTVKDPCVHVLPEVYDGQKPVFTPLIQNFTIERERGNGQISTGGFYIPAATAQEFPNLSTFFGLQGEGNRRLLASLFNRPVTWLDYCEEISNSTCQVADGTASRYPQPDEEAMFFKEELYTGHFRATDSNNCDISPSCTGHFIDVPCTWSQSVEQRLYWNNIVGLSTAGGPDPVTGSYDGNALQEVWRAANATRSHIIMPRWSPEVLSTEFAGTDYEFTAVTLPVPTKECLEHRASTDEKCSPDITERRGDPRGRCDSNPAAVLKLLSYEIGESFLFSTPEVQSPAYPFLVDISISEFEIQDIITSWSSKNVEQFGYGAREAVCEWVVDNLDQLMQSVPYGYPKRLSHQSQYSSWYLYCALAIAIVTALTAIVAMLQTIRYRNSKVILFAQPIFLLFILTGFMFISIGAATFTLSPTPASCMSSRGFVGIGFSIEMIPVIVKTAAINRLVQSSKKMQRVNISRRLLLLKVFEVVGLVIIFYMLWFIYDPLGAFDVYVQNRSDEFLIERNTRCGPTQFYWGLASTLWHAMLLLVAGVLAFQSRNLIKQFNESGSLGIMVFSHVLFAVLRTIFEFFYGADDFPASIAAALISVTVSLDTFAAMTIYVIPKLLRARKEPDHYSAANSGRLTPSRASTTQLLREQQELTVLTCTANIGNAEPTRESMEAWIPPYGETDAVNPLDGVQILSAYFDVVAIGMQESTWKLTQPRESSKNDEVNEQDILNALEEHHTAQLRVMIQDILGEQYSQVAEDRRGQMRLYIYARNDVATDIEVVRISGANTGIGNVMANKGGIVVSMEYKKTRIAFLSAHLAAHEGESYYQTRCENLRTILKEGKTFDLSTKLDLALSSHHIFVMGDLNFRTNFGDDGDDTTHEAKVQRALEFVENSDFGGLYSFDELHKGIRRGDLLCGFDTLPCRFPPTFKVLREPGFVYKTQRTPSYTDRVLYKSSAGLSRNLRPLCYEPCVDFITSDHKPIRGAFAITPNEADDALSTTQDTRLLFKEMSCAGLPAGDSRGTSDPYLMFMWDGVELEPASSGFKDRMRILFVGKSWPRTQYVSKTLDPVWDEKISLLAKKQTVGPGAMLFVIAMDYDALSTRDTYLGTLALNLKDILSLGEGETTKELLFDRPLQKNGVAHGRVKFHLDVVSDRPRKRMSVLTFNPNNSALLSTRQFDPAELGEK